MRRRALINCISIGAGTGATPKSYFHTWPEGSRVARPAGATVGGTITRDLQLLRFR